MIDDSVLIGWLREPERALWPHNLTMDGLMRLAGEALARATAAGESPAEAEAAESQPTVEDPNSLPSSFDYAMLCTLLNGSVSTSAFDPGEEHGDAGLCMLTGSSELNISGPERLTVTVELAEVVCGQTTYRQKLRLSVDVEPAVL